MDAPNITLFSTPLISTWVFDETHRVLFDVGDGVTALLDSRIHKIRLACLTHTHRDHCAGLMQLLNLRGGAGDFATIYPEGSGSARAFANFLSAFDSRSTAFVKWAPIKPGDQFPIEPPRHFLRPFETSHYPNIEPARVLSLGYHLIRTVDKIKKEFRSLSQDELDILRRERGKASLLETIEDTLLTVTGDTMPLHPDTYRGTRALMHECTFLDVDERCDNENRGHPHSCLQEVLELAIEAKVGRLGLYHISRRYEDEHILGRVKELCNKLQVSFPVSVALPGRIYENFFSQTVHDGNNAEDIPE